MTKADAITAYLSALLATIRTGATVTNRITGQRYTYATDIGSLVDVNKEYTEHPDQLPSCVLLPGKNATTWDDGVALDEENHSFDLTVEAFITDDKSGSQAALVMLDLARAIKSQHQFGGLIEALQRLEMDKALQMGETLYSVVQANISVRYIVPFGSE